MTTPPRLLALETATARTLLALGHGSQLLAQASGSGGASASAELLPSLMALLQRQGWTLGQLDAIVCGRGPGAFTGLRTAISLTQGLAYGTRNARHPHGLPVVLVDTLLTLAWQALHPPAPGHSATPAGHPVLAVLDARMGEVYAAVYRLPSADAQDPTAWHTPQGGPWLATPAQLPALVQPLLRAPAEPLNCLGNAPALLAPHAPPSWSLLEAWPSAAALLALGHARLARGLSVRAAQAQPLYVRDKVALTTAERSAAAAATP